MVVFVRSVVNEEKKVRPRWRGRGYPVLGSQKFHSLLDMADHQTSPNVAARKSRPKKKKIPSEEPMEDVEVDMEAANPPPRRARSYVTNFSASRLALRHFTSYFLFSNHLIA